MICTLLAETHRSGSIRSRNFYDDITSRAVAKAGQVAEALARHAAALGGQIAAARLTYSQKKTIVVASSVKLAKQVVHILKDK